MQITTNHLLLSKPDQKIWNILSFVFILLKLGMIMSWLTLSKMSLDTRYSKNAKWDILKKTATGEVIVTFFQECPWGSKVQFVI